jgi:DNA-directed RNA polymerase subunit beta
VRVFNRHGVDGDEARAMSVKLTRSNAWSRTATTNSRSWAQRLQPPAPSADEQNAVSGSKGLGRGEVTETKLGELSAQPVVVKDRPRLKKAVASLEQMKKSFSGTPKDARPSFEDKVSCSAATNCPGIDVRSSWPAQASARRQGGPAIKQGRQPPDPADGTPHLEDGTSVDVVLNAWACVAHEHQPDLPVPGLGGRRPRQADRRATGSLAGRQPEASMIDHLTGIYSEDTPLQEEHRQLVELAQNLSKGVPFHTR